MSERYSMTDTIQDVLNTYKMIGDTSNTISLKHLQTGMCILIVHSLVRLMLSAEKYLEYQCGNNDDI